MHIENSGSCDNKLLQYRLNRLELERAYLAEQNAHLSKELALARYTIHALKTITTQKETALQATRQELDRAYFRIRMLGMTLLRQERQYMQQREWYLPDEEEEEGELSGTSDPHHLARAAAIEPLLQRRSSPVELYNNDDEPQQQLTPPESPRVVGDSDACSLAPLSRPYVA